MPESSPIWHTARVMRTVSTGLIEVYFDDIRLWGVKAERPK